MTRNVELARLFVQLEAETKGLDSQLAQAEKSLGRTADFIKAHPVAAAGALGAALLAVGVHATQMAGEVDTAMRQVAAAIPGAVERLDDLKAAAREMSDEFGLAQTAVAAEMQALARTGIDTADGLIAATKAAILAHKASGEGFEAINKALDASLDAFGLSASHADTILAQLIATSKGKTNLSDLGDVLTKVGPQAAAMGVKFDVAAAAVANIQTEISDTKGQVKAFKAVLENEGVAGIERIAGATIPAAAALNAMHEAVDQNLGSMAGLAALIETRANNALIEFGEHALPVALVALEGLSALMATFGGGLDRLRDQAARGTIESIVKQINTLDPHQVEARKQAIDDLAKAVQELVPDAHFMGLTGLKRDLAALDPSTSAADLGRLQAAYLAMINSGEVTGRKLDVLKASLQAVNEEISKHPPQGTPVVAPPPPEAESRLKGILAALKQYSADQKEAGNAAKAREAIAKAALESELSLLNAQAVEYLRVTRDLHEKLKELRGKDREDAEKQIKRVTDNLLLKWSGLYEDLVPKVQHNEKKVFEAVKTSGVALSDYTLLIQNHGVALGHYIGKTGETKDKTEKLREKVRDTADAFRLAVGDVHLLADEFGLLKDGNLRAVFEGLEGISGALDKFARGDTLGGAFAGIASLTGLLKGVLGESPAAAHAREILRHNSEVIEKNTAAVLANTPGSTFTGIGSVLGSLVGPGGEGLLGAFNGRPRATGGSIRAFLVGKLGQAGVSFDDFEQLAKDLGIELDLSTLDRASATLKTFFERFQQAGFGTGGSFADSLDAISRGLSIGTIKPGAEFGSLVGAVTGLKHQPTGLASILQGIDVLAPGGKAAGVRALQELFTQFGGLNAADQAKQLGDLTKTQFFDLIDRFIKLLQGDLPILPVTPEQFPTDSKRPIDNPNGPGGPTEILPPVNLSTALDDVLGSDSTVARYLAIIADNTAAFNPVGAPSFPASLLTPQGAGGTTLNGGISVTVNMPGGAATTDPTGMARVIADQVYNELNQRLGSGLLRSQQLGGSAVRN